MGEAPGQVRSLRGEVIGMPELGPEAQIRAGKAGAMAGWCQRKGWARGQEQGHRTCSSSCTMPRLLFSTAWMSGERPLLMSTASMSAPRSSKSSTASWHSVFTATCRAVSPEGEGDSVKPGPGALQPQEDAGSCQTAPPCARVGAHRRNCGPPGPLCREPRCPAGPAGRSGCGARTPGGLPSGHGGPVPWGWHQPSPRAEPQMATW